MSENPVSPRCELCGTALPAPADGVEAPACPVCSKLKPCPFCGRTAAVTRKKHFSVGCVNNACGVVTDTITTPTIAEAAEIWNTRRVKQ